MGKGLSIDITEINGIVFVFHVDSIYSSEYSCVRIPHCYVIRYRFTNEILGIIEIIHQNQHYSFSSQMQEFSIHYENDYCKDI